MDYHASVLTQNLFDGQADEAQLDQQLHSLRQVVEEINQLLSGLLGLCFPRARTLWGLLMRLSAKVAACNLLRMLNHLYDREPFAQLSPFAL